MRQPKECQVGKLTCQRRHVNRAPVDKAQKDNLNAEARQTMKSVHTGDCPKNGEATSSGEPPSSEDIFGENDLTDAAQGDADEQQTEVKDVVLQRHLD